ncbi:hypothetical protein GWI33_009642, partial [Rhynchophorus ferrugineus]
SERETKKKKARLIYVHRARLLGDVREGDTLGRFLERSWRGKMALNAVFGNGERLTGTKASRWGMEVDKVLSNLTDVQLLLFEFVAGVRDGLHRFLQ